MLNGYLAYYGNKTKEIYASTSYGAQQAAAVYFKVSAKKQYMISIVLCELADSTPVVHSTSSI